MMMAVSFQRSGRLYYLDPGPHQVSVGTKVLVPTDAGPEVAECVWAPQWVDDEIGGLPVCAGLAGEKHLSRDEANRQRRGEAKVAARRLIREHDLPMKVIAVDYLDEPNVFTIYFGAPHRVDFRRGWNCARSGRATRPGCRAGSARAGGTCAARRS
jgi:cell fate regulator YaaT (PSP1 superfamily)